MIERDLGLLEYEKNSERWYIAQYLKYGSVEEVFRVHKWDLWISVAHYHRLVKKHGIVKASGRREVSLSEVLYFFAKKALEPTTALETLYYEIIPPNFQTSLASLHRIYNRIIDRDPVRRASALVITPANEPSQVLFAEETHTSLGAVKQRGDVSIPMCFSDKNEPTFMSVLRVLQQECFSDFAVSGKLGIQSSLANEIIPKEIEPFAYIDVLDVRVGLFKISLPETHLCFSSFKLQNHRFIDIDSDFSEFKLRHGVSEMINEYKNPSSFVTQAVINKQLLAYASQ